MHDRRFKLMRHISSLIEVHHGITAPQVCIYYILHVGTFKRENLFVLPNVSYHLSYVNPNVMATTYSPNRFFSLFLLYI